jgi:hypothetical protein
VWYSPVNKTILGFEADDEKCYNLGEGTGWRKELIGGKVDATWTVYWLGGQWLCPGIGKFGEYKSFPVDIDAFMQGKCTV